MYSVKSGYQLALNLRLRSEATSSAQYAGLWKWIWGLDVIPKVRLFMWKCLANALPTNQALRSRCIDVEALCRRCGEHEETMEHALRDCAWVEALWSVSSLRLKPISGICSIPAWFEMIRNCPHRESHSQFAMLAWTIWYARNLLVFQQKDLNHVDCLATATRAQWVVPVVASSHQHQELKVSCTRVGQMKISTDAVLDEGVGIGVGVVMKDGDNGVVRCRLGFKAGIYSVVEAEALAMLESFYLCREHGITDAIFETDCQALYWILMKRENDLSYLGVTLRSIYALISSFRHVAFSWTSREGNVTADRLASYDLCNALPFASVGELPPDVNPS
ncbi:uncharacterized protein LOC130994045 [Salvia miltiorrhiza]|uniref:uncharacterized protein LOC130994045 n=1 Tax=Salvia miltiorrhiza TaxID=226208 RepID=UPI0025AB80AD|nr:uncharacterized protein LOC130994045 [Salvia miltiorrhiza]